MSKAGSKEKNKQVAVVEDTNQAPDFLKEYNEPVGLEGLDSSDYIIPRLKLLQPLSNEVSEQPERAKPGIFWCTSTGEPLGDKLTLIPCTVNKRVLLMAPIGSGADQTVLARADDCIHWDKPNSEFTVKLKNVGNVTWNTGPNVPKSKLLDFGSSNPNNPNSPPAATLFYEYLVYVVEYPHLSPLVVSLYKTSVSDAKQLNTMLAATRKPMYASRVVAQVDIQENDAGSWFTWNFRLGGWVQDKATFEKCKDMAERYKEFRSDVEETGVDEPVDDVDDDNIPY